MNSENGQLVQVDTKVINLSPSRLASNFKRARIGVRQKGRNARHVNDLDRFRDEVYIEDEAANDILDKYRRSLLGCFTRAMCQYNPNDKNCHVALKAAHYCNHRLCNICNGLRAKKLRRKIARFLQSEEINVPVKRKQRHFFPGLDSENPFVSGRQITESFDFMHLTLTVPHNKGLWNGREYYAKELLKLFNTMRKCDWWADLVFAGEACIETVQTENNLHIHIHALLLVKKNEIQSRNRLMLEITLKWNELTIDHTLPNSVFDEKRKTGLRGSFSFIKDAKELETTIGWLDARGSTMVGLNSLYKEVSADYYAKTKKGKFIRDGKFYCYVNKNNFKMLLSGIMECLKYHFEPCSMENKEGALNVPLLLELLPNIYRQRLFTKFGAFYGLKQLNISEDVIEAAKEDFSETAQAECFDPVTGDPLPGSELIAFVCNPKDFVFKKDEKHVTIAPSKILFKIEQGSSLRTASKFFMETITNKRMANAYESEYQIFK